MTEQEWLACRGSPRKMWATIQDTITPRQKMRLAAAWWRSIQPHHENSEERCQSLDRGEIEEAMDIILTSLDLFEDHGTSFTIRGDPCNILRDIIGNPFRGVAWTDEEGEVAKWVPGHPAQGVFEYPGFPVPIDGDLVIKGEWLTWNDGTIPKLAAACYEGEVCGLCKGSGTRPRSWQECNCNGTGTITPATLDPHRLAVLADALEEAGCTDEGLLGHLRSREKCPDHECGGRGRWTDAAGDFCECAVCGKSGYRDVRHYPGCWAVELFLPATVPA